MDCHPTKSVPSIGTRGARFGWEHGVEGLLEWSTDSSKDCLLQFLRAGSPRFSRVRTIRSGSQQKDTASFAYKMEFSRLSPSGMDFRITISLPFTVTTPAQSGQPVGKGSVPGMEPGSS